MNKLIIYINNESAYLNKEKNTVIILIELSNDIIDILDNLNFILGGDIYIKNINKI